MKRLALLDGLRGYFLFFMMLNHLTFAGGLWLARINHAELSFVQDAQGFIFLSGMLIGLVHARRFAAGQEVDARRRILARVLELYAYAAGMLLLLLVAAAVLPFSWAYWETWMDRLAEGPDATLIVAAFALLYQPTYMDILPQYIFYLLVSPLLLRLVADGRWHWVAGASVVLWLAVQTGVTAQLTGAVGAKMVALAPDLAFRVNGFDPFAWQAVYVAGLLIGAACATGALEPRRLLRPDRPELAAIALALLVFFLGWRLALTFDLVSEAMRQAFARFDDRRAFSLLYALNFAALAYLVAWLLVAGAEARSSLARIAAGVLHRVLSLPFLVLLGRHSLQVYAYHVVVVYALAAMDWAAGGFDLATRTAIALAALWSLALPAWIHERVVAARPAAVPPARAGVSRTRR